MVLDIREEIRNELAKLPESWQNKFNRMYGSVDTIPDESLNTALLQIERSLEKLNQKD